MYKGNKTMGNQKNMDNYGDGIQGMPPKGKKAFKRITHKILRQKKKEEEIDVRDIEATDK